MTSGHGKHLMLLILYSTAWLHHGVLTVNIYNNGDLILENLLHLFGTLAMSFNTVFSDVLSPHIHAYTCRYTSTYTQKAKPLATVCYIVHKVYL